MKLIVTLERDWDKCQLKTEDTPEGMAKLTEIILKRELLTQTVTVIPEGGV